jgi:HAD superfamily hydrolase (TIGR01484 family)
MIDVDGTLIPNSEHGMPSAKVTAAINSAKSKIHIGFATTRPLFMLSHIFDHLALSGPSIINGGAQVIDSEHKKILWDKKMEEEDIDKAYAILKTLELPIVVNDGLKDHREKNTYDPRQVYSMLSIIAPEKAERAMEKLSHIPSISVHIAPHWIEGKTSLIVAHAQATKQHGILEVAKILGIETHEIIGVGDGYNDFPLLMACGLKVAMGNAVDDLKAIADYVAPSVDDDGVADVIEKFVLN